MNNFLWSSKLQSQLENLSGIFLQPRCCVVTVTQSTASKCSFSHALTDTELCLPNHWPSRVAITWSPGGGRQRRGYPKMTFQQDLERVKITWEEAEDCTMNQLKSLLQRCTGGLSVRK